MLSVIISNGEVLVAIVNFDDGEIWDIRKKGYELNDSQNKCCWVENDEIYYDEKKVRKLRKRQHPRVTLPQSNQQQQKPQQSIEMGTRDCIDKYTVFHKTRLPKTTRDALANSENAFDNFALKLNNAARFDCRVKIEDHYNKPCIPVIPEILRDHVILEDEDGKIVNASNAKYMSTHRPLTEQEKDDWLVSNSKTDNNSRDNEKKVALKISNAIINLFNNSQYEKRKYRFSETDKNGFLYKPDSLFGCFNDKFSDIVARQRISAHALNLTVSTSEEEIDWRLIVGLGNESVYETSITLHHIYGIPYIPASSIKGVVRSWIVTEVFRDENAALQNTAFRKIFGTQETAGKVWFFDAFPLSKPTVEVDIMNPHYMPYYSDGDLPADYYDPKPIPFLTVKHGISFQLLIGIKEKDNETIGEGSRLIKDSNGFPIKVRQMETNKLVEVSSDTRLLNITEAWLKKALEEHGIGAKTSVGYGYMSVHEKGEKK